jgi:cytidylate kinase
MAGRVISITEALGSGAPTIARSVGERLGIPLVDREVFLLVAEEAGVSPQTIEQAETSHSFLHSMIERMGVYLEADESLDMRETFSSLSVMTSDNYRELIQGVIRNIADTSEAVIIGHGSHVILKDYPSVLRVYLNAPFGTRAARIAESSGISLDSAEKLVREHDQKRRSYFEEQLKVRRNEAQNYDLCLRTERLTFDACTDLICSAVDALTPEREPAKA